MNRSETPDSNMIPEMTVSTGTRNAAALAYEDPWYQQMGAILWIILAWIVGTFVFEMGAVGQEPGNAAIAQNMRTETTGDRATLWRQLNEQETQKAIALSGIGALDRLDRNLSLRPMLDAMITREETKRALRSSLESSAVDQSVEIGEAEEISNESANTDESDDSQTRLAWGAQPAASLPGIIKRVVHSVSELMKPVYVSPHAADANLVDEALAADSSIAFVETDTQQGGTQDSQHDVAVVDSHVKDSRVEDVVRSEQSESIIDESGTTVVQIVADDTLDLTAAADDESPAGTGVDPAQVAVMTSPSELHATTVETLESDDEPLAPLTRDPQARIVRGQPYLLAVPQPADPKRQLAGAAQTDIRVAAKWPFELAQQPTGPGVSLNVDQTDVRTVFEMLARGYGMNILVAPEVQGLVTANVDGLTPEQALNGILRMCDLRAQREDNLIYVYASDKLPASARQLRMFTLDFARAEILEPTIQGLLSPVGNAYVTVMDSKDNLKTHEAIVVIDIPEVIAQVESYVYQADQAPRQVMIEAHVLEVELTDDITNGVDFAAIFGGDFAVGALGLTDPITVPVTKPVFFAAVDGDDVKALITVLETTTDAKTLASPRVMVVNGQNARIQVGQQLGFTVATVTQTSTIQDIQFLDTGVVLTVTPTISRDNRILLQVKPQVSTGQINPKTLLPEQETREAETSVLLNDHQGVVIGGLIQETDRTVIKKLPWLGDFRYVGKLFQRREASRSRSEVIVALVPHIVEGDCVYDERAAIDLERAQTPLLQGPLQRTCRPWEASMPDPVGLEHHLRDSKRGYQALPPAHDH